MTRLVVVAVLLLNAGAMFATPVQAVVTGANGAVDFGLYVGPFGGTLNGEQVTLYCVDFANNAYLNTLYSVNLSRIAGQADLFNTRYGSLQLYQEAAWLTEQYSQALISSYGDIQATIWQLFDPSAPAPSSGYWLDSARANYGLQSYDNYFVVTNVGPVTATGQFQEFLTVLNPSMGVYPFQEVTFGPNEVSANTPDAATMGLVGLGLIAVAVLFRWLRSEVPRSG